MKTRMIAAKPFRYGTRMLVAGDVFEARSHEVRALEAVKRATIYAERPAAEVPPPSPPIAPPDIDALRDRARSVGLRVDARWSAATLSRKIEEAGGAS